MELSVTFPTSCTYASLLYLLISAGVCPNCWYPLTDKTVRHHIPEDHKLNRCVHFFIETCAYTRTFQGWNLTHTVQLTLGILLLSHYNTLFCLFMRQENHNLYSE